MFKNDNNNKMLNPCILPMYILYLHNSFFYKQYVYTNILIKIGKFLFHKIERLQFNYTPIYVSDFLQVGILLFMGTIYLVFVNYIYSIYFTMFVLLITLTILIYVYER